MQLFLRLDRLRASSERIVETAEIEPATDASASAWEAGGSGLKPQALAWDDLRARADGSLEKGTPALPIVCETTLPRVRGWLTWDTMMNTAEPMTARGAHYTALLETIDHQGAAKLHAREREQLLEAADALLFGEPENRRLLRSAEDLIESLETNERWSAESCEQLREHLYGCDAAAGVP